ncbi:hypothetical protein E2320_001491 [Naja naja]|nr:hypothetical protein E2320_001491 [Naja naja]
MADVWLTCLDCGSEVPETVGLVCLRESESDTGLNFGGDLQKNKTKPRPHVCWYQGVLSKCVFCTVCIVLVHHHFWLMGSEEREKKEALMTSLQPPNIAKTFF